MNIVLLQLTRCLASIVVTFAVVCLANGESVASQSQANGSNSDRTTAALANVAQFKSTRALAAIRSAIDELAQFDNRSETRASCIVSRRRTMEAWASVLIALQAAKDPTFDPNDDAQRPSWTIDVPGRGGYPSGTDPNDIADPKLRAEYEQLVAANTAKTRRVNYQAELRNLYREAMARTSVALHNVNSTCPDDEQALRSILHHSGLTDGQIEKLSSPQ
jgi:cell division protein FtsB